MALTNAQELFIDEAKIKHGIPQIVLAILLAKAAGPEPKPVDPASWLSKIVETEKDVSRYIYGIQP
jgi:hypothetical protein